MSKGSGESEPEDELTTGVIELYRHALRHGQLAKSELQALSADMDTTAADLESGLQVLIDLSLLRPAPDGADAVIPASPDSAIANLVSPLELEIKGLQHQADDLRSRLSSLHRLYFENRQASNRREAIDVIEGTDAVRLLLGETARRCQHEVFAAQPGILSEQAVEASLPHDLDLLERGIHIRSLFQHPVRVNPQMRKLLGSLATAGGEIRTCDEIPDRLIIFDREIVFIPDRAGEGGAVVVREPSLVNFLFLTLEQAWSSALTYDDECSNNPGYGEAGEDIRRSIMRMLASGAKDELIARRLSISLRTCRRHIAEIMKELRASSRFQAGCVAGRMGLLEETTDDVSQSAARQFV